MPTTRPPRTERFDAYFERRFRKNPVIMGLSLMASAFVSGFGAHAALSSQALSSEPLPSDSKPLEQCLHSLRDVLDQCHFQCADTEPAAPYPRQHRCTDAASGA